VTEPSFSIAEVERSLRALGKAIEYPPQPDLALGVRRRIQAVPQPAPAWRRGMLPLRRPAAVLVAAVVVLSAFLIVSEPARIAVADWLGLDDVRITFEPPPEPVAGHLGLGERVSLQEAQDAVRFDVLVPATLGPPDEVYLDGRVSSGMVSLVYAVGDDLPEAGGRGAGLIVTQFEATLRDSEVFTKFVNFETIVSEVEVRGVRGYWIGAPHDLFFRDVQGDETFERSRLVGPALVWQEGDRVFRIESQLSQSEVIEIAETLE
jgi:hypothetical protein